MCPPNLLGHKRGPGGAVENTALGLTPSGESIDVDIDPPDGNASQSHLSQSLLGTREPLVVGVIEFVAIRRQLSKTKPLFSSVPSEPSDHFRLTDQALSRGTTDGRWAPTRQRRRLPVIRPYQSAS